MARPRTVFVDTGHWLGYLSSTDRWNQRAIRWHAHLSRIGARLVTTDWVLAELVGVAVSRAPQARGRVLEFLAALGQAPRVEVVHVTIELREAGRALLSATNHPRWSWVDAVSFALMRQRRLTEALAEDRHFSEAGFRRLLLEDPEAHA